MYSVSLFTQLLCISYLAVPTTAAFLIPTQYASVYLCSTNWWPPYFQSTTHIVLFQQLMNSLHSTHNSPVYRYFNNFSTLYLQRVTCFIALLKTVEYYVMWKGRLSHSLVQSWSWWWRSQWCCCIGLSVRQLATYSMSSVTANIGAVIFWYTYIYIL